MQAIPKATLSRYQQAVLTEMGIAPWKLLSEQESEQVFSQEKALTKASVESTLEQRADIKPAISSDPVSQLAKLKQAVTQPIKSSPKPCSEVLMTFEYSAIDITQDVLLALGLEQATTTQVSIEALGEFIDYPLAWVQGEHIKFSDNILTTPDARCLANVENKKQLWQLIQDHAAF